MMPGMSAFLLLKLAAIEGTVLKVTVLNVSKMKKLNCSNKNNSVDGKSSFKTSILEETESDAVDLLCLAGRKLLLSYSQY